MPRFSSLDHFTLLGHSGLRVSPLCLGTMTFGREWGWGSEKDESRRILDAYADHGGNFIDTANFYTGGTSESWLGEFLAGRRDRFVLATKYTLTMRGGDPNAAGNHRKNLVQSLDASLKRLKTDCIDLYWLHIWDMITPIEEVMRALDDCVRLGKILHVGVSDMPAWKIAQANTLALWRDWSPFIALQIEYSLIERSGERELIPMARDLGLGVMPWSPLGGGVLTGKYRASVESDPSSRRLNPNDPWGAEKLQQRNLAIADTVVEIARETGHTPAQLALAWVLARPGIASPVIGARTLAQLEDNLGALQVDLSPPHLERLNSVSHIDLGFPHSMITSPSVRNNVTGGTRIEP